MKAVGWKVFYGDGSTFDSTQGSWEDAPTDNVQCVNLYFDDGFHFTVSQGDYYTRRTQPGGSAVFRLYYLGDEAEMNADIPDARGQKLGKLVSNEVFQRIYAAALADSSLVPGSR